MDDYDFRKIDREMGKELDDFFSEKSPPETILIPIGEYNGPASIDSPNIIIDENFVIWMEVKNPEYGEIF